MGGQYIFNSQQETVLKGRVFEMAAQGFPVNIEKFRSIAYQYACNLKKIGQIQAIPINWSHNNAASWDWWDSFKKRNPDVSKGLRQNLSNAKAQAFNSVRVNSFYKQLKEVYEKFDLLKYPQLIYNADETGLSSVSASSSNVLAQKGTRAR